MQRPGGELAVKTKLVEQYIDEFGKIIQNSNISVLPTETANLKTFFEGLAKSVIIQKIREVNKWSF